MFKSIGLVAKRGEARVQSCLEKLVDYLRARQLEIVMDALSAQLLPHTAFTIAPSTDALGMQCDLVIVIGGDGTLLQAARSLAQHDTCLLGINLGRLGFLTDICPTEMEKYLGEILDGAFLEEERFLIRAELYRDEQLVVHCNALNDIIVHRWNMSHMLIFKTTINGHLLSYQRADGLIVATPTGSTAYALSAGGPITHPSLNALILVTICPHTLSTRPIVVDGDSCIHISIDRHQVGEAQLNGDGILCKTLKPGDQIRIEKYQRVRLIHPQQHDHYATLRTKLNWGKVV